jgi:hypothetical protein
VASRAVVTHYADEVVVPLTGNFSISAYFLIVDPALFPGTPAQTRVASGVILDSSAPATWTASVKAAVIARALEFDAGVSYPDLTTLNVFVPTIA